MNNYTDCKTTIPVLEITSTNYKTTTFLKQNYLRFKTTKCYSFVYIFRQNYKEFENYKMKLQNYKKIA